MNRKIVLLISLLFFGCRFFTYGQASICPPNVDFEFGNLSVWNFSNGLVADGPIYTLFPTGPVTPMEILTGPAPATDYYGLFPTVAPGGGTYSCKLGRGDTNNNCAERAVYYVDIPAGTTIYSLVYHYAAVLEVPSTPHTAAQEPRFVVGAYDSATDAAIPCAAYTYEAGTVASGFLPSTRASLVGNGFDVVYKPWTFGNMKFPGENGRTVAIEFTANDCTLGAHFGYGYFDMSCGLFANVISCGTTTETLTAPPGFSSYQWLDSTTMLTSYGTTPTITVAAPTVPTTYAVIITPFVGYGCPDTLYSRLVPSHLVLNPTNDTTICAGNTVTLSSGATDIATPLSYSWSPAAGLSCTNCATPLATPTATTAYTVTVLDPGGCSLSHVFNITVFSSPLPIGGSTNACLGAVTVLTDGVGGGVWSSLNTAAATIGSSTGVVTGLTLDTATITYSFGAGLCTTSTVVTVNPLPLPITGSTPVCAGSTMALGDITTGGTWSSGSPAIATVDPTAGVVGGVAVLGGNAVITFTAPSGCTTTAVVTVNPLSPITGVMNVCTGLTTTLSDATAGGTWGSSDITIATVTPAGVVAGLTVVGGTATISYTTPAGCVATAVVTVNPLPAAITGTMSICNGFTTTLHDASTGGAWSDTPPTVATVVPASGLVTSAGPGIATVTYTLPTGCLITAAVTVNPTPPAILSSGTVCTNAAIILNDAITGGTWSSSSGAIATVGSSSGVVVGLAAAGGTATITYTSPAGCVTTTIVTVNPLPPAITGIRTVCAGLTTILHDATAGGAWSSGSTTIATIDPVSGTVSGILPGTSTISYTMGTGCAATAIVTVNVTPVAIGGTASVCVGAATLLSDAVTGGTWSSSVTATATVGSSSGIVTGVVTAGGTSTITYALATGCSVTTVVTVNPLPSLFIVTGGGIYCAGGTGVDIGLTNSTSGVSYQLYNGGTLFRTLAGIGGPLDFGLETAAGAYTVIATNSTTGCTRTMTGTVTVSINPVPALHVVAGGGSLCSGSAGLPIFLTTSDIGINYQLHNGLFVGPIVAGTGAALDFGAETIAGTYTVIATNPATGCSTTMTGSATITVLPLPALFTVTGGGGYCAGGAGVAVGLSGSAAGITYGLYNNGVGISAIAGTGGAITFGLQTAPGTYSIVAQNATTLCSDTMTGRAIVTINPLPAPITGPATVCVGATVTEIDDSLGGTWSSGTPANASVIAASGIVTGLTSATTTIITYTLPTGCAAARVVSVSLSPSAEGGPSAVCVNSTILKTDPVPGGVWTSSAPTIATANSTLGAVTGLVAGTASIIYTLPSTGCSIAAPVTVNPLPVAIAGTLHVCVGLTTILNDASAGGTWGSGSTAIATISSTGFAGGADPGTSLITYTLPTGCIATTTVTVYASPVPIAGPTSVCQSTTATLTTLTLTDAVTGGIWTSSNTAVATITPGSGVVMCPGPGTSTITYTLPGSCSTTVILTVNPVAVITGPAVVCQGSTITLSDATPGGTWGSSATGVATVGRTSGIVGGVTPGTTTITYTTAAGCTVTTTITVNITPSAIIGTGNVCVGLSTALSDAPGGGTWSSSAASIATVTGAGVVWGAGPGDATITYMLATGCSASSVVTVNPLPAAIAGAASVCQNLTITLTDITTGGGWSSSAAIFATVDPVSGVVTGRAAGSTIITYTIAATGCLITTPVLINPVPQPLTGPMSICVGYTTTLDEVTTGGTWSSSATAIAAMGSSAGLINGIAPGTSVITYTLPTSCQANTTVTVVPVPSGITSPPMVCEGSFALISVPGAPGGTWTTGVAAIATIGTSTGILSGIASGTVIVSYTIGTSCYVIGSIIVNPLSPISGDSVFCVGQTVTLTDTTEDGIWSSVNPSIATAITTGLSTGDVTAVAAGTAAIKYTLPTGCIAFSIVTINPLPAAITGITNVCVGNTTTLSDFTTGGTWSSSDPLTASVDPATGVVTGNNPGPATISYILTATGCPRSVTVVVNALPTAISGPSFVCPGATINLNDAGGGVWSAVPATVATISATGVLTGTGPGTATVTYTLPVSGCSASSFITVEPWPTAITGTPVACLGATTTLSNATPGGVWTSSNSSVAPVTLFSGTVTGGLLGTATITYTTSFGCVTSTVVTVDPSPAAITGAGAICPGTTITLSDITPGAVWSSIPAGIASVDPSGVVTGVSAGVATIYYTLGGFCAATAVVTVNPLPGTITGSAHVCSTGTGNVFDITPGGAWASSNTSIGTIMPGTGFITGVLPGTTVITYTLPTGCSISSIVTVDVMPSGITGAGYVCGGSSVTLSDDVSGGVWSSTTPVVATVGSATGVVTGGSIAGVTSIAYTIGACFVNKLVTVYPLPGIYTVTGGGSYCAGSAGVHIGLSGSTVGVLYYLYLGSAATGTFTGTGAPLDFGFQSVAGSYTVVAVASSTTCSSIMTGSATVTITPTITPAVTISETPGVTVCAGTSVIFNTTDVNGGLTPAYQWSVNGINVSTGSSYTFIPANGDVVAVALTSDAVCPAPATVSSTVTMTVNMPGVPAVSIAATPGDTVCQGTTVDLRAVPVYGGLTPTYVWMKNGTTDGADPIYSFIPANGDVVYCILTSNYPCRLADTASSHDVIMTVDTPMTPAVTIVASPGTTVGLGMEDTLTANVVNGGVSPTYQWYLNSLPVAGATTNTYMSNNFNYPREDSVTCMVTADDICKITTFQWVYINVSTEGVKPVLNGAGDIVVLPNPNKGEFTVKGSLGITNDEDVSLEITDMLGQVVYRSKVVALNGTINEHIALSNIANGMYLLSLHSEAGNKVFHIVIEQ